MNRLLSRSLPFLATALFTLPLQAAVQSDKPAAQGTTQSPARAASRPAQGADAKSETPKPAGAAGGTGLRVAVTGLDAKDRDKVTGALSALSETLWVCPACKASHDAAGHCKSCDKDLVSEQRKVFGAVAADPATGTVDLRLAANTSASLMQVEKALSATPVKVDEGKFLLTGMFHLRVQGPGDAESAKKLQAALDASGAFSRTQIRHEADSRDYVVMATASATPKSESAVRSAIQGAASGFTLSDVTWSSAVAGH